MYNYLVRTMTLKTNLVTIVSVVVAIVCMTITGVVWINQNKLNNLIKMQNIKIGELIKANNDIQFSKSLDKDSTVTSIDELKKMIQDLSYKNSLLSMSDTDRGEQVSTASGGILTLNNGVTSVNIYSGPKTQSTILSTTVPDTMMFYTKKEAGWYQVDLGVNQLGWIQSKFVTDLNR